MNVGRYLYITYRVFILESVLNPRNWPVTAFVTFVVPSSEAFIVGGTDVMYPFANVKFS